MEPMRACVLAICLSLASIALPAQPLTIYSEEFPPFNYTDNGQFTGLSTQIVEEVMQLAGLEYRIESYPWARAMRYAQARPDVLIYSISRRANREDLFQWIGILVPSVNSVFALSGRPDITVGSLEDLHEYSIGTTIDDAREHYLLNHGFALEELQRIGGDDAHQRNYRKLKEGKIDLWPIPDAVAHHIVRQADDDPVLTLHKVLELTEISQGGYYLAASLTTPEKTVYAISSMLEAYKRTPDYRALLEAWGISQR